MLPDQGPNVPGAPDEHASSTPIPTRAGMPYTVNALGKPALPNPNKPSPGQEKVDPAVAAAEVAARYKAEVAAAQAKSDAQFRADTGSSKARPASKAGKKGK